MARHRERGAELFVLGCTGMIEVCDLVREKIPFPVIEPGTDGIKLLETLVSLGISHTGDNRYMPVTLP